LRGLLAVLWLIVLVCGSRTVATAQTTKGTVSGQVVDPAGAVVQGAEVKLTPSGAATKTDSHGTFTFSGVASGTYTVSISYVGFATFTTSVKVEAGETATVNAALQVAGTVQQVVVQGVLQGEAQSIHTQETDPNIVNAISAQQIASLPNATVADAAGRLPGVSLERDEGEGKYIQIRGTQPRMNETTVDGVVLPSEEADVSEVKLDAVPADLVSSIVVNKTLSASQDGNAIGGSTDLRLRQAPDVPTISFNAMGGYNPIDNGRHLDQFDGTFGDRFGPDKRFGAIFTGSYDLNDRGIDDIEPTPDPNFVTPYYDNMEIRQYLYYRTRYGYAGSLDYRLGPVSKVDMPSNIYAHYFYSGFWDDADVYHYVLSDQAAPDFNTSNRREDFFLSMVNVGGHHVFSKSVFDWNLAASNGRELNAAGDPGVDFPYTGSQTCAFDQAATTNRYLPQWDCPAGARLSSNSFAYNPANYSMGVLNTSNGPTDQVNLQASAAYSRSYFIGSHSGTFEVGFKIVNEHKYQNTVQDNWDPSASADPSAFAMSNFLGTFHNSNYYFGDYPYGPVTDWKKVINFFNQNPQDFTLDPNTNLADSSNFNLQARYTAGFIMNTLQFGRFSLQTGLRFEGTQLDIRGFDVSTDANGNWTGTTPTESTHSYITPLPSVQLKYLLTNDSDIRAVYGRGLSRPEPYDLVPYIQLCKSCSPPTVSYGNPALQPEHANDFDVLYEHFINNSGVIQGGFFYKQLIDPIYYTFSAPATTGPYAGYLVSNVLNGTNAYVYGLEFAYMQRFSSLPGALSGLGLTANYTYSNSQACGIPGRSDCPPLQRQTPNIFNLIPTYRHGRLFASVGLTYQGTFLDVYSYQDANGTVGGAKGPGGDDWFFPHFQVDMQVTMDMGHGFTTYFEGENLNDEVFGFYNGSPQYMIQREFYRPEYIVGVRWNNLFEHK
jgi:TonB-dependent receptor